MALLNAQNVCVGHGYLGTLKPKEILYTHVVRENKVLVYVTNIVDGSYIVDEPFVQFLSEFTHTFIR